MLQEKLACIIACLVVSFFKSPIFQFRADTAVAYTAFSVTTLRYCSRVKLQHDLNRLFLFGTLYIQTTIIKVAFAF